jgi:hypothetical protein
MQSPEQASLVLAPKFVLSDPENLPASGAEGAVDAPIAGLVAGDLGELKHRPVLWPDLSGRRLGEG